MLASLISLFSLIIFQGIINKYTSCLIIPFVYLMVKPKHNLTFLLVLSFLYEIIYTNHLFILPTIIYFLYQLKNLFYKNYQYNFLSNILLGAVLIFIYNILIYGYLVIIKYQIFNLNVFFKLNFKYLFINIIIISLVLFIKDILKDNKHIIKW